MLAMQYAESSLPRIFVQKTTYFYLTRVSLIRNNYAANAVRYQDWHKVLFQKIL